MIPARNIYFMLLYAWGHFRGGELALVGEDDSPNLPTLLARILNFHTHRLLRSGLDRGYVSLSEEGRSIRGRLHLSDIAKRQTVRLRGTAVYEFDELTPDVLHNRILYETLLRLSKSPRVDAETSHQVGLTALRFRDISRIYLTPSLFGRVSLSRSTAQYRLLMNICRLLVGELMPDTSDGSTRIQALADDEVRMEALFEEFLRSFYRVELPSAHVSAKEYTWSTGRADFEALALLPKLRTDITLRTSGRTLTIEAKFNKEILVASQFGSERVRSAHLYQLYSYMAHAAATDTKNNHSGLLLYAQRGEPIDACFEMLGHSARIATIDLEAHWRKIHCQLLSFANEGLAPQLLFNEQKGTESVWLEPS